MEYHLDNAAKIGEKNRWRWLCSSVQSTPRGQKYSNYKYFLCLSWKSVYCGTLPLSTMMLRDDGGIWMMPESTRQQRGWARVRANRWCQCHYRPPTETMMVPWPRPCPRVSPSVLHCWKFLLVGHPRWPSLDQASGSKWINLSVRLSVRLCMRACR